MKNDVHILYSGDEDDLSTAADEIANVLRGDGIGFEGPSVLPAAPAGEVRRVEDGEPLADREYVWLQSVNPHRLGYIVSHLNAGVVFGRQLRIPRRHTGAKYHIGDVVDETPEVYYDRIEASQRGQVPFSYDPSRDFKTEPDR